MQGVNRDDEINAHSSVATSSSSELKSSMITSHRDSECSLVSRVLLLLLPFPGVGGFSLPLQVVKHRMQQIIQHTVCAVNKICIHTYHTSTHPPTHKLHNAHPSTYTTHTCAHTQTHRWTETHTHTHRSNQTDKWTDRQTDGQTMIPYFWGGVRASMQQQRFIYGSWRIECLISAVVALQPLMEQLLVCRM